jgi:crotonobetainyl-CoA:carnitine CoA-transferase CaiB-like acyl-CoA transferase
MRPFEGIRVLDFTHVYAGPFATFQLAVMGAEVIKIEPPGSPDQMRAEGVDESLNAEGLGTNYQFNNQGKKALSLDISRDEGRQIAIKLIASADVLVENYTGALARHELGPEQALSINPRLIYCDMSGYGSDNRFAGRPAYDPVIQAASGMMSVNGTADQEFLRVGPPLIDYGMGAQTAFAIASALHQRHMTGKGQVIEANMFDAALMMMSPLVASAIHAGKTDLRTGNVQTTRPGYAVFPCRDGDLMLGAFTLEHHCKLFNKLSLHELLEIPEEPDWNWIQDNGQLLRDQILHRLKECDASDWEEKLNQADIPSARVRDLHETLCVEQPHRAAHSRFERVENSRMTAPIAAFRFAEDGPDLDPRCARHGEDSAAVLTELGYDEEAITTLREQGII